MLPKLPSDIQKNRREILQLRGVNYTDCFADGDLVRCENLSARRWPYLCPRRARKHVAELDGTTAITAWEKLVAVQGGKLLYDGQEVGFVSPGEKQFAVVNTRLVIWPDKVYLDLQSLTVKSLGGIYAAAKAVFTENTLSFPGCSGFDTSFAPGDTVKISGCSAHPENNKQLLLKDVDSTAFTFPDGSFTPGTETNTPGEDGTTATVTIERKIPEMDLICASENRLWGCCNRTRTIYASALGDPTNFYTYQGLSTDAFAVAVGSEGDFTGCCALSGSVLFWKEHTLHKLMGSFPAEYALYSYSVEGLQRGCHQSMAVVNEVLYYLGTGGVFAYTGGTPRRISPGFDGLDLTEGRAGTDGERYYLSVKEGEKKHLFVYDIARNIWLREDDTRCTSFARVGRELFFLTDEHKVYLADLGVEDRDVRWEAEFAPFFETIHGRKRYSRLLLRLELPRGAWVRCEMRCNGGQWETCAQWSGGEQDTLCAVLPVRRCNQFSLRLTGKGSAALLGVVREFSVGSER